MDSIHLEMVEQYLGDHTQYAHDERLAQKFRCVIAISSE